MYYYTTKIIEIQIHSQIKFVFVFFRESTATERDASPNELKVNFLIQNPHQNELEDAKSFRKQEKNVEKTEERNFNQYASISTHASTSIRIVTIMLFPLFGYRESVRKKSEENTAPNLRFCSTRLRRVIPIQNHLKSFQKKKGFCFFTCFAIIFSW